MKNNLTTKTNKSRGKVNKSSKQTPAAYMSDETFDELKQSLEQALDHARGKQTDVRVTHISKIELPPAPAPMSREQVGELRRRLNYSQSVFARVLNVSVKTVQAWEQGRREPSDAALKLLNIANKHPEVLMS